MMDRQHLSHLRLQFSLRTFFIVTLCLGMLPWLVTNYSRWRSSVLWQQVDSTKRARDAVQIEWNQAHERLRNGDERSAYHEQALREEYFEARSKASDAFRSLTDYYGVTGQRNIQTAFSKGEKILISDQDVRKR